MIRPRGWKSHSSTFGLNMVLSLEKTIWEKF